MNIEKLNILYIADVSIAQVVGGAERVLLEQAVRFSKRGHNIHILTRKLPTHLYKDEIFDGVREWRYETGQTNPIKFIKNTYLNARCLFEKLQNTYKFDFINFHQPFSSFGVIQSPCIKKLAKLYTCHSLSFEEFLLRHYNQNGFFHFAERLLNIYGRKYIEKKVLKQSDRIVVLSEFTKNKLKDIYGIASKKVSIIPGGVDLNRFKRSNDRIFIRKTLDIPNNKVVILTVRNLVNRMGLENLILAIKNIIRGAPNIYVVIGGDGPLRSGLIKFTNSLGIKNFIRFEGYIPEEQLPSYYQMADLFVLPTKELEGFGLVTLEAMACGLPVVGTPVGGTKEILGNFDPNFLFKGTDADSIAELILKYYHLIKHDPQRWKEISHRCRKYVEDNYSWEKNVDTLEELFKETVKNH